MKQLEELKKWIEKEKKVCQKGYVDSTDELGRTMYSSENMAYGLVIQKIDKMISNEKKKS